MIKVLILLSLSSLALSLRCYDCDPRAEGQCYEPEKNSIRFITCEQVSLADEHKGINKLIPSPKGTIVKNHVECYTLYFQTDGTTDLQTGVYRGCAIQSEDDQMQNSCEFVTTRIKQSGTEGNVTYCKSCSDEKCNTDAPIIEVDAPKGGPNGVEALTISVITLLISSMVCFYISVLM